MIALLSNINIEPIRGFLKSDESIFTGYNTYIADILNHKSVLYSDEVDKIFLFLDIEELLGDMLFKYPSDNSLSVFKNNLDEIFSFIYQLLIKRNNAVLVINNVPFISATFISYLDTNSPDVTFRDFVKIYNNKLKQLKSDFSNALVLDWERIVLNEGINNLFDPKFWYLGRMKLNNKAFKLLSDEFSNLINSYKGKTQKVLIVDLDNTLWGGIAGEDGLNGIKISEDGIGKAFRDFQKLIKSLKEIGVILAINSKNNESDIDEIFQKNNMMILKYDDFIVRKINWNNKVQNLIEIASDLDLGLDSFVFIDDNPVERQLIKENLPEVCVPDFPSDISYVKSWFLEEVIYKYFTKVYFTHEDKNKTFQYLANAERKKLSKSLSIEDFIKSLNIKIKIYINLSKYKQRIAQLTQKTNQFNLTTKRYTETDIERFINSDNYTVFALGYEDKFNNEGIVGLVIILNDGESLEIDTFLLSCRIIGRDAEFVFLLKVLETFKEKNIKKVNAVYIKTKKNGIAESFYSDAGLFTENKTDYSVDYEKLIIFLENKTLYDGEIINE